MADLIYVFVGFAFFALCGIYVRGCERIVRGAEADESPGEVG